MGTIRIGGIRVDLSVGLAEFDRGLSKAQSKLKRASADFGKVAGLGLKAAAAGFAGIATGAIAAADSIDQASRKIRAGTGATGQALKGLEKDFREVFKKVDDSSGDVATAIADLNTRLGLTGAPLQRISKQFLDLADITGGNLGGQIAAATRVLGDWGIEVKQAGEANDLLFKVSQQTGIQFETLSRNMVQYGAILRQFGFDFEEAAVLMGKFEKDGVNLELVFSGLKQSATKFAKEGIPLRDGLQAIFEKIKQVDEVEAIDIAGKVFGARSGADFADAIRGGRFEIDELLKTVRASGDTISQAADDIEPLGEKLGRLRNNVTLALEPLGRVLIDLVTPALEKFTDKIGDFAERLREIPQEKIELFAKIGAGIVGLAVAIPTLALMISSIKILGAGIVGFGTLFIATGPIGIAIAAFAALGTAVYLNKERIVEALDQMKRAVNQFSNETKSGFQALGTLAGEAFKALDPTQNSRIDFFGKESPLSQAINLTAKDLQNLQKEGKGAASGVKETGEESKKTADAIKGAEEEVKKLTEGLKLTGEEGKGAGIDLEGLLDRLGGESGLKKQAKEAAEAISQLSDEFENLQRNSFENSLRKQIEDAISKGDTVSFNQLIGDLRDSTEKGVLAGYKDAIEKGGDEAKKLAIEIAKFEADERIAEYSGRMAESLENEQKEAFQNSVTFFQNIFENAITGAKFDLEDALEQVAVGFASQMAAAIAQTAGLNLGSITSPQGLGQSLANELLGNVISGGSSGGGLLGSLTQGGGLLGSLGLAGEGTFLSGLGAGLSGTATVPTTAAASAGLSAGGTISAAGPYAAAAVAAYAIADKLGAFDSGPTNPETIAREGIVNKLEELIEEMGGLEFFDSSGNLQSIDNIVLGSSGRFNQAGWADSLRDQFGSDSLNAFTGVGSALESLFGFDEGVGGQIGAVLIEQFGGDIAGLQAIIQATGLTYENFIETMLTRGKQGEESWLAIISQVNAANDAFQEGIAGTGMYAQAAENFFKAQGKGAQSLLQLTNLAVEGQEASIVTIEGLLTHLSQTSNLTAVQIEALASAFAQQGISTLEELQNASEETRARVTAAVDAYLQDNGGAWAEVTAQAREFKGVVEELNGAQVNVQFNIKTKLDNSTERAISEGIFDSAGGSLPVPTTAFANGGVVNGASFFSHSGGFGVMGEAGPEAILPLSRKNGRLGVDASGMTGGSARTINIDARGADAGVEARILDALSIVEERVLSQTLDIITRFR